jgi:hypothetical protein
VQREQRLQPCNAGAGDEHSGTQGLRWRGGVGRGGARVA